MPSSGARLQHVAVGKKSVIFFFFTVCGHLLLGVAWVLGCLGPTSVGQGKQACREDAAVVVAPHEKATGEVWALWSPAPRCDCVWLRAGTAGGPGWGASGRAAWHTGGLGEPVPSARHRSGTIVPGRDRRRCHSSEAGPKVLLTRCWEQWEVPGSPTVSGPGDGGAEGKDFSVSISAEL